MKMKIKLQRWNLFTITVLLAGAVWIWISTSSAGETSNHDTPAPREGFQAPDFSLQSIQGETIQLGELRGQAVLVNVWASWCPPCKSEMPTMQLIYEQYQAEGFTILAINTANQDNLSDSMKFISEQGLTFPILLDNDGTVSSLYQVRSLPTSFFIDPDGIIQEVVIGGPMSEVLLRTRVERVLEEVD
jgi:cytochrome c biogenesis protein CcmG/thiol:disulfide interchange protein DsbE